MTIYIISIFLSAFLIFQIQPLIGKMILPWFGGSSSVWSTAMMFFQVLLTGGYTYAFWLIERTSIRNQRKIHTAVLGISLLILAVMAFLLPTPITPGSAWEPVGTQNPIWNILLLLTVLIGLPFFILASNSTLIQAWYNRAHPQRSFYWLYALSNVGSLIALVTYPLVFERVYSLQVQAWIWTAGYVLFALFTGFMISLIKSREDQEVHQANHLNMEEGLETPPKMHQFMWISLSATGSILLLATTSQITQEIAPIPLLWVVPLAVYLLTFVLSFSGEGRYHRPLFTLLLALGSIGMYHVVKETRFDFYTKIGILIFFLFSACMVAHGELYRLRPQASYLSRFYLLVSVGGALGGITVNLIAPVIFDGYWEIYLGWVLILVQLLALVFVRQTETLKRPLRIGHDLTVGVHAVLVLYFSITTIFNLSKILEYQGRNFYGVSKVYLDTKREAYRYIHGSTIHGFQFIAPDERDTPTSYFWARSGIAIIIRNHPRFGQEMNVGVLGLGIGTLASYGRPGDHYRFYEINPEVIELAEGKGGYFSFLADSSADISVVIGDARLSLEKELTQGQNHHFDLLVMDAFSSDSVPVHLITREAFETYLEHLAPDGVIAVNITNYFLDLQPVIWQLGQEFGLKAIVISSSVPQDNLAGYNSKWMFLARDSSLFSFPEIAEVADQLEGYNTDIRLWTDDYNNLIQIIYK